MSFTSLLLPILSVVSAIIILILIVVVFYLKYKEEELPRNITKVWNFMPQYSDNRADGLLKEVTKGPKRSIVEYYPGDINFMDKNVSFKPAKSVVENAKLIPLARGTHSKDVDILIMLPPTPEDLPEDVKNSYFGKILMKAIEDTNERVVVETILRERLRNIDTTRMRSDTGRVFTDALENLETISHDQLRVISKDKGKSEGGSQGGHYVGGPPKI